MKYVGKITLVCWEFVVGFGVVLVVLMNLPEGAVWISSALLGLLVLILLGVTIRRLDRREGFELGWFLAVKKGYWHLLAGAVGVALFLTGAAGLIAPQQMGQLIDAHAKKLAAVLIVLFWTALISTFLGWGLICFSEADGYRRLKNYKSFFYGFALASVFLVIGLIFVSLFLDVIDENFLRVSSSVQNWVLALVALATISAGLYSGKYADLKLLSEKRVES